MGGMPIHDWTRVSAGTFHDFHHAWISELRRALNGGVLPEGFYAQAEQVASQVIPDVLTLQQMNAGGGGDDAAAEAAILAARRKQLVIRHSSGNRIVAIIEIVSPGNKDKRAALEAFVDKALSALAAG